MIKQIKAETVHVLGIPLWAGDLTLAISDIINHIIYKKSANFRISATGAHGLVFAMRNKAFATCLKSFYINLPDGMPGVWIGRLKGARNMRRCYGPDFFKEVMIQTSTNDIKHFFCGGKEGVSDELKIECERKFNNFNVVGTYCPPFREMLENEWHELGVRINQSSADIVWIGLSTPKQEQFATKLSNYCRTKFIITVGAAFDFHTGKVKQAPAYLQKMGLEWLFRLIMEPKRLWRRYIEIVPMFIFYNLKEFSKFMLHLK